MKFKKTIHRFAVALQRRSTVAFILGAFMMTALPAQAKTHTIRYGTIAPKGSIWAKYAKKIKTAVEQRSNNKLRVRIYFGESSADEQNILRKMNGKLLDMASFSGIGLGSIVPETRVFELPFFFNSNAQVDHVVNKLYPTFQRKFNAKGYVLAGWGEGGFVYLMTRKPIKKATDMNGVKIWAPKGDQLVKAMLTEYGLVPVYLGFDSVLPQLQTGGLDAVYAPPMAAVAFQWAQQMKFYSNARLANATGATLIRKEAFEKLPADLQKILLEESKKYNRELVIELRRQNQIALKVMENVGIKKVTVPDSEMATLKATARRVQNKMVGVYFNRSFLQQARRYRNQVK